MTKKELSDAARLLAKAGGDATLKKYGKKHFKLMSKKRWEKVVPKKNK